jgi:hypothetical protein
VLRFDAGVFGIFVKRMRLGADDVAPDRNLTMTTLDRPLLAGRHKASRPSLPAMRVVDDESHDFAVHVGFEEMTLADVNPSNRFVVFDAADKDDVISGGED